MIHLPDVTLISVSSVLMRRTVSAMKISMEDIRFGEALLLSHIKPKFMGKGIRFAEIPRINNIDDYNKFMIYSCGQYIDTTHALIVQSDGYVLRPDMWRNEFLIYDFIGAPWPLSKDAYIDPFGNSHQVGNGGFSLRSKRLMELPSQVDVPYQVNESDFYRHMNAGLLSEDGNICVHNRHIFVEHGCVFAPLEVAGKFSRELPISGINQSDTFGFHKYRRMGGRPKRANWLRCFL